MKRSLLMFAAAAGFLVPAAAPLAVLAQDQPQARQEGPRRPDRGQPQRQNRDADRPRAEGVRPERRPDAQAPQQSWQRPDNPRPQRPDGDRPDRPGMQRPDPRPDRPQGPDRPGRPQRPDQPRPDAPNRPERPDRPGPDRPQRPDRPDWNRPGRPDAARPDRPNRPGFNRDRDYREFHNRWNRDQWRRDWDRRHRSDWWRNDSRFRGWSGVRIGFYFAPGYGYYSVPRSYWNRQYYVGQYLPDVFWRYQVNDWRTYGLGYPPPGTRWVYVDNSIYLIDDYDGYIIEVVRDAWRW
ncbi:MAG: RcnB family protein [Bordetella sp.]|nr:RcnB family protein [Bordetella sp.]